MPEPDPIAALIPWYANGSLAPAERREVEAHLSGCVSCRSLLAHARAFRTETADPEAGLEGHVQAQLLLEYHDDREALDEDVRQRVAVHLDGCDVCRDALAIVEELARLPEAEAAAEPAPQPAAPAAAPGPPRGTLSRLWSGLSATLLRPGAALGYLLLLLALYPSLLVLRTGPEVPPTGDEPPASVLRRTTRLFGTTGFREAGTAPEPVTLAHGAGDPLLLELVTDIDREDLDDPAAAFVVELARADDLLVELPRAGSDFDAAGVLHVLLTPERLEPGTVYEVRIRFAKSGDALDGRILFRRAFRLNPG